MSATNKPYKCPEQLCTAALTTKSNLNRHMRQHRRIKMPCGKELGDHPSNNVRHQKNCCRCQSVMAESSGYTHPHSAGTPSDGSAYNEQQNSADGSIDTGTWTVDGYACSRRSSRGHLLTQSGSQRDQVPGLDDLFLQFKTTVDEPSLPATNSQHFTF
ncbi:hypothetical protein CSUB01_00425 [Colletotrichum sublineola]|uniref:C2H2-type domain-containing protein n=1 Tax=Colletotrichum sublineola TaxID=1173701 RepID=A0A066X5P1_COLSU|nr:hypothetical protein CSUB01_00425 [Colletotrichum sublineola]